MATEDEKKRNMLRLLNMTILGVTKGVWDFVGESSFALSKNIGDEIIRMMEKEMGLEIAGETPMDVVNEISRLFVDEFGFARNIEVDEADGIITLNVQHCINRKLTDQLAEAGVEKPFICPVMNAVVAAFRRQNIRARQDVVKNPEGNGSIITFELI